MKRTSAFHMPRRTYGALLAALTTLALSFTSPWSVAAAPSEALFEHATAELRRGAFGEALAQYEQLSDRGVVDANVSFNRALAYLSRAESPARRAGDLGQAVAGLRESITLSSGDDTEAAHLVELVRREIARERSQRGLDPLFVEPPLGRALVQLLPENGWAGIALFTSLGLSVALLLRRWPAHTPQRLAGNVASVLCALFLLASGGLAGWAVYLRKTETEAVVVVEQATLLHDDGTPLRASKLANGAPLVPEGASVFVKSRRGRLSHVRWGNVKAWVQSQQLRPLASR